MSFHSTRCECGHGLGSHTGCRGKCNVRGCACRRLEARASAPSPPTADELVRCVCSHVAVRHGLFLGERMKGGCEVVEWRPRTGGRSGDVKCSCTHFAADPKVSL